jgi:hypothetical protein
MFKIGIIVTVIVVAAILGAWACSGNSNQTAKTTSSRVAHHTTPTAHNTPPAQDQQAQEESSEDPSANDPGAPGSEPSHSSRLRKRLWNLLHLSSHTTYRYSRTSGRGIAERLGFAGTEPTEPGPDHEEQPTDYQPTDETPAPEPQLKVIQHDRDTVILVPKCPAQRNRMREAPEYAVAGHPHYASSRPHCSAKAYLANDGLCHCYSGGVEIYGDFFGGFCKRSREEQIAAYYRNHPEYTRNAW